MEHSPPIAILTSRSPANYALLNALRRSHALAAIVFETQTRVRRKILWNRLRKLRVGTLLNQFTFKLLDLIWFQSQARRKASDILGDELSFRESDFPDTVVLETPSVNSAEVVQLLLARPPSLVIVSGTSVLGPMVLEALDSVPVINLHCGITPRYRGAHGAFWAIVNGDWKNVGTTVHFVDAGIDSGRIILQGPINPEPQDSPRDLGLKQYAVGIRLVLEAVARILAGDTSTLSRGDLDSRLFSSPTLTAYLHYRKRMKEHFPGGTRPPTSDKKATYSK
jgi:folate-dependent phosphoribosylglycinamide formyltransferase PurN